mgnify:CR=1 FL=1
MKAKIEKFSFEDQGKSIIPETIRPVSAPSFRAEHQECILITDFN